MANFKIGDRVVKNPATWRPSEFDGWGAGEGVGVIADPPWEDHIDGVWPGANEEPCVDVVWPAGRAFQYTAELLPAPQ